MNKLEKIHADNTNLTAPYALLSTKGGFEPVTSVIAAAEITEQIAIEFLEWIELYSFKKDTDDKWSSLSIAYARKDNLNNKELFQEFLKTKHGQ